MHRPRIAARITPSIPSPMLPSQSRAFSMIEILTSVAIMVLLAALLVPALSSVRFNALTAKDLANLRYIQAANIAYSGEHNGNYVPVVGWDGSGNNNGTWHDNQ